MLRLCHSIRRCDSCPSCCWLCDSPACATSFAALGIFKLHALAAPQAVPRLFDSLQEPWVMLELKVEPIIVGRKSDQDAGGLSVPRNYDLFCLRHAKPSVSIHPHEVIARS